MVDWTDEDINKLAQMRANGDTFLAIADALGRTRSAIAGACMRLGIKAPDRASLPPKQKAATRVVVPFKPRPVQPYVPATHPRFYGVEATIELRPGECRFPIGDTSAKDFHYCCDPALSGLSYCAHHQKTTRTPIQRGSKETRNKNAANKLFKAY